MFTTRAAIGDGQGNCSIETIEVAAPAAGEVLVEIRTAGLCHTDWDSKGCAIRWCWDTRGLAS